MNTLRSIVQGRPTYSINQYWTVLEAARYMAEKQIGAVAVLDGDRVVGIFSERDLMMRVVAAELPAEGTLVADVMTREVVAGAPEESCEDGLRRMRQARCRHLPVVEGGQLIGFISLRDLLQIEVAERDEEIRQMNAYVHSIGY